jgi:hypothetical protein
MDKRTFTRVVAVFWSPFVFTAVAGLCFAAMLFAPTPEYPDKSRVETLARAYLTAVTKQKPDDLGRISSKMIPHYEWDQARRQQREPNQVDCLAQTHNMFMRDVRGYGGSDVKNIDIEMSDVYGARAIGITQSSVRFEYRMPNETTWQTGKLSVLALTDKWGNVALCGDSIE